MVIKKVKKNNVFCKEKKPSIEVVKIFPKTWDLVKAVEHSVNILCVYKKRHIIVILKRLRIKGTKSEGKLIWFTGPGEYN